MLLLCYSVFIHYLCEQMTHTCSKCRGTNVILLKDEYHGEYTSVSYICEECNTTTTKYYDLIYNFKNTFSASDTQKEVA